MSDHLTKLATLAALKGWIKWDGNPKTFKPWHDSYAQVLMAIQIEGFPVSLGFLHYILTPAEKLLPELAAYVAEFKKHLKPADLAGNATASTIDSHKRLLAIFNDQQAWINALNTFTPSMLPTSVVITWMTGTHNIITKQFSDMSTELRTRYYLTMTDEERTFYQESLRVPDLLNKTYPQMYSDMLRNINALSANSTPVANIEKTKYLREAALQLGAWSAPAIRDFLKLPPDQRTFEKLHDHLEPAWINRGLTELNHFAAAGALAQAAKGSFPSDEVASLQAEIKSLKAQLKQPKPQDTATNCYCWTCGGCAHKGLDCPSPAPGHIPTATFYKQQGGSTRNVKVLRGPGTKAS